MKNSHAIIAISDSGKAILIRMLTEEPWIVEAQKDFDYLAEFEFNEPPGLYYADCLPEYCGGYVCRNTDCAGDCFQVDWCVKDALYLIN